MTTNKSIDRRKMLGSMAAFATTTALTSIPAGAQSTAQAVGAFYHSGEFTYCDAKILASHWNNTPYQAKVLGGRKIMAGAYNFFKSELRAAVSTSERKGVQCTFADANNPPYSYNDAVKLARHWGNGMTPYDAKLKVVLNIKGGGNLWVRSELAKAR